MTITITITIIIIIIIIIIIGMGLFSRLLLWDLIVPHVLIYFMFV
jgi:hypothetical protein